MGRRYRYMADGEFLADGRAGAGQGGVHGMTSIAPMRKAWLRRSQEFERGRV